MTGNKIFSYLSLLTLSASHVLSSAKLYLEGLYGTQSSGVKFWDEKLQEMGITEDADPQTQADDLVKFISLMSEETGNSMESLKSQSMMHSRFAEVPMGVSGRLDAPCDSQSSCDTLAEILNACISTRDIGLEVYDKMIQVNRGTTIAMDLLCGCIYVFTTKVCVLKQVTIICSFPYQVWNQFSGMTFEIFEMVKSISTMCNRLPSPLASPL